MPNLNILDRTKIVPSSEFTKIETTCYKVQKIQACGFFSFYKQIPDSRYILKVGVLLPLICQHMTLNKFFNFSELVFFFSFMKLGVMPIMSQD